MSLELKVPDFATFLRSFFIFDLFSPSEGKGLEVLEVEDRVQIKDTNTLEYEKKTSYVVDIFYTYMLL